MFTLTAKQLLNNPVLFNSFCNDPEDYTSAVGESGWDEQEAREWCERFPDAILNYDGTEWAVYHVTPTAKVDLGDYVWDQAAVDRLCSTVMRALD